MSDQGDWGISYDQLAESANALIDEAEARAKRLGTLIDEAQRRLAAERALADRLADGVRGLLFRHGCWCADPDAAETHEIACKASTQALAAYDEARKERAG